MKTVVGVPGECLLAVAVVLVCCGANHRTTNFLVTAETPRQAKAIAAKAEALRRDLAVDWLGRELPDWPTPCLVTVTVAEGRSPSGSTSYEVREGLPQAWQMRLEGSWQQVFDSVLPHEVTHTVIATHFGRPVPRWAEEGLCVVVEAPPQRQELELALAHRLRWGSVYPVHRLLTMREYPSDILSFYSQGYSLVQFLIQRGGKRKLIAFLSDARHNVDWSEIARSHYGFASLDDFQAAWLQWAQSTIQIQPAMNGDVIADAR